MSAVGQAREIPATQMDFISDGFEVLSLPAVSRFSRQLDGSMGNTAVARTDDGQWQALWKVFQVSGVVIIRTSIAQLSGPTEGFEQAAGDFEQCLAQLALVTK
jgi:hypothetical protein